MVPDVDLPVNMSCWEEGATCGSCHMTLSGNETMVYSLTYSNILAGFAVLISILGFAINLLTLLSLLYCKRVRQQLTTPYIISVLCSDLLFSAFILPMLASRYYNRKSEGLCNLFPVLFYICLGAFVLSMMMLTINRTCILVLQERTEKIMKPWVSFVAVFLCWMIPLCALIPPMTGTYGIISLEEYTQSCTIVKDDEGRSPKIFLANLFFYIPCTVMMICNFIILVKIKLSSSLTDRKIIHFVIGIFSVFVFFLLTFMPPFFIYTVDACFRFPGKHTIAYIMCWTGCIANPIIFLVTEKSYRDAVRLLLFKKIFLSCQSDEDVPGGRKKMRLKTFRAPKKAFSYDAD